jgi:hypothetical protein
VPEIGPPTLVVTDFAGAIVAGLQKPGYEGRRVTVASKI